MIKNFVLCGKKYTILTQSREQLVEWLGKDEEQIGGYEHWSQQVRVANDLPTDTRLEALLHECIHAISLEAGLGLCESRVRLLSIFLYGLLRDNPKLWERMWEK